MVEKYCKEDAPFLEVASYFLSAYKTKITSLKEQIFKNDLNKSTNCPTGRANLFTLVFGKQPLV